MPKTLREILDEHEAGVRERIEALRAELAPLERELADVRRAQEALDVVGHRSTLAELRRRLRDEELKDIEAGVQPRAVRWAFRDAKDAPAAPAVSSPYEQYTMKQLVEKALREQFPAGATSNELLHFFGSAWGRTDVVRTSLSPQLSRLKQEGQILLEGNRWRLAAPPLNLGRSPEPESKTATDR